MSFFHIPGNIPSVEPDILFSIGLVPISNTMMMIWVITLLIIVLSVVINKTLKEVPGKFQSMLEVFYEGVQGLLDQITRKREATEEIFPLIGTLFVFIGLSNIINLIPGFSSLTINGSEMFRTPTSDFNVTFALALAMIILVQVESLRDWGFFGYIGRFVQIKPLIQGFRKGVGEGMSAFINFLIGLLDIVSELAKVLSLSMRLFGNIFAGEVLMVILLGAFAYALPAVWMGFNLFTGIIQALVFGALVAAYYGIAKKPEKIK